jgi:hypothetical protein
MADGLDTRGLASGFQQGFSLMDQYQRGQEQSERAQERHEMQREQYKMEKEEIERARDLKEVEFALTKIANGMEPSDDEIETLRENPKYWPALDDDTDDALAVAERVTDPNSNSSINDPEALASFNQLFGTQVNKGEGGQKMVTGVYPGTRGDSVTMDLEVTDEKGNSYRAPMTDGRSNREDDDAVMEVPVESLARQTQGMRALRKSFQNPEARQQAATVLSMLRGDTENWELQEHDTLGMIQRNTATGEIKPVKSGAGGEDSGSNYWNRPTSTQKDIEYMVAQGIAEDREDAWRKLNRSQGENFRRNELQLDQLNQQLDELNEMRNDGATWRRMSEDRRAEIEAEIEDLSSRRDRLSRRMFSNGSPSGLREPGPEEGSQGRSQERPAERDTEQSRDTSRNSGREGESGQDRGIRPGLESNRDSNPDRERDNRSRPSPDEEAEDVLQSVLG